MNYNDFQNKFKKDKPLLNEAILNLQKKYQKEVIPQTKAENNIEIPTEEKKKNNFGKDVLNVAERSLATVNDVGMDVSRGMVKAVEGVGDYIIGLAGTVGGFFGADTTWAENAINYDWTDKIIFNEDYSPFGIVDTWAKDKSYVNEASPQVQTIIHGTGEGIGQMLPSLAIGNVGALGKGAKAASMVTFATSAAGRSTEEALLEGADLDQAMLYGTASGVTELAIEMVFGGIGGMGAGIGSKIAPRISSKIASNTITKIGMNMIGEGLEEVASEYLNPYIKRMTYDEDAPEATNEAMLQSFIIGALASGVLQGANVVATPRTQRLHAQVESLIDQQETAIKNKNYRLADFIGKQVEKQSNLLGQELAKQGVKQYSIDTNAYNKNTFDTSKTIEELSFKPVTTDVELTTEQNNNILLTKQLLKRINSNTNAKTDVVFTNDLPNNVDGAYHNGVIYINVNSKSPYKAVFKHELTHSLENSGNYQELSNYVINQLKQSGEYEAIREDLIKNYSQEINNLSLEAREAYINQEIVSNYSEKLFNDETSINRLVNQNRNLAQRIYDWVKEKIGLFTGKLSQDEVNAKRHLEKVESLYKKALETKNYNKVDKSFKNKYNVDKDAKGEENYDTSRIRGKSNEKVESSLQERRSGERENELLQRRNKRSIKLETTDVSRRNSGRNTYELALKEKGITPIKTNKVDAELFRNTFLNEIKNTPRPEYVDVLKLEEYAEMDTYLSESRKQGFAISKQGDIKSVFNSDPTVKKTTLSLLPLAIENGGITLDNFDGALSRIYSQFGFEPVARIKFVDEFSPDGWKYDVYGRPDIIFMVHNGDGVETVINNYGNYPLKDISTIPYSQDYDSAKAIQQEKANELRIKKIANDDIKFKKNSPNNELLQELLADVDVYFDIEQSGLFGDNVEENFTNNYNSFVEGTLEDVEIQSYLEELLEMQMPTNKPTTITDKKQVSQEVKDQETVETKKSRFQDISIPEWAKGIVDEVTLKEIIANKTYYVPITDAKTLEYVKSELPNLETDFDYYAKKYIDDIESGNIRGKKDIAVGITLIQEALKKGDIDNYVKLAVNLTLLGTELGQQVQAFSLLKKLTPKGELYYLEQYTKRHNKKYPNKKMQIDTKLQEQYLKETDGIKKIELKDKILDDLASQLPVTFWDKLRQWRYLSMLANPKTHVRNFVGNAIFIPVRKLKNRIAGLIESGAVKAKWINTSDRVHIGKKHIAKPSIDFAKQDFEVMKDIIEGSSSKHNETNKTAIDIQKRQRIFKRKLLEKFRKWNYMALEVEDVIFMKKAYIDAFSEYITAKGITINDLNTKPDVLNEVREFATIEAQRATYRQFSRFALAINNIKMKNQFYGLVVDAVFPFAKTPINILKTGLAYSPLGLIKSVTYDTKRLNKGEINVNQYIDNISQGLTGSMIAALGMLLAKLGILRTGGGDDDKENKYLKDLGSQPYSLMIGGKSYTLDWVAPSSMPLFFGAKLQESFEDGDIGNIDGLIASVASTADPLTDLSMLSSLNSTLATYQDNKLAGVAKQSAKNLIAQHFPTLGSQIAKVFDDKRRTTTSTKSSGNKELDQYLNYLKSKVPGFATSLEPYVNVWGEYEETGNVLERIVENMVYPFWVNENKISSTVDNELISLYTQTGNNEIYPTIPRSYYTANGERYDMTPSEYTEYKINYGKFSYSQLETLFNSKYYKGLSLEEKEKAIVKIYNYARDFARKGKYYTLHKQLGNNGKYLSTYILEINSLEADVDREGNTIPNSKKKKVFKYINSLPLSKMQKNLLYNYAGYTSTTNTK